MFSFIVGRPFRLWGLNGALLAWTWWGNAWFGPLFVGSKGGNFGNRTETLTYFLDKGFSLDLEVGGKKSQGEGEHGVAYWAYWW